MMLTFLQSLTDEEVAEMVALRPEQMVDHEIFVVAIGQLADNRLAMHTCAKHEEIREDLLIAAAARLLHLAARNNGLGLERTEELLMKTLSGFQERDPDTPL